VELWSCIYAYVWVYEVVELWSRIYVELYMCEVVYVLNCIVV